MLGSEEIKGSAARLRTTEHYIDEADSASPSSRRVLHARIEGGSSFHLTLPTNRSDNRPAGPGRRGICSRFLSCSRVRRTET